jgi:exonuclease III
MTRVRCLTYNIDGGSADHLEPISAVLAHARPDLVALSEANDPDVVAALAERSGVEHVWARGSGDRHVALLSRFPIVEWRVHNTPPLTQAALEIVLELPGQTRLTIYNVHLLPYLLLPFEIRRWQAVGQLLEVIRARRPGPHLIVGDLNAIAPGDRVLQHRNPPRMRWVMALQANQIFRWAIPRLLEAGYVDCFRRLHPDEDGFTWMPGNRTTRYDYIFADAHAATDLRGCCVLDDVEAVTTASDHLPLLAEFDVNA